MTVFSSGISMYAMAKLLQILHIFDAPLRAMGMGPAYIFHLCILASAIIVLLYVFAGGLSSAIYNEVLQFFLIVAGFVPLVYLGLKDVGGWEGLRATLPAAFTHSWRGMSSPATNPMGVDVFGVAMGLGFVLSFGYWCTDFLVVQRAMAADSMAAARRTPLIAAIPKSLFPFLVIHTGLLALAVPAATARATVPSAAVLSVDASELPAPQAGLIPYKVSETTGEVARDAAGRPQLDYDLAIPVLLLHYFPAGLLGLGLTALLASFMSGMAGNVTAFNTVWTYDIYQAYIRPHASDGHYLWMGRMATIFGVAASVATAYVAAQFNNIMDVLQLVFAFVNAPLLATFLLGMFWKRTTGHGAFTGLLTGTAAAALHHMLTLPAGAVPGVKGGLLGVVHTYYSEMAQNFSTAIVAWIVCFVVTILVSLATKPRPDDSLRGLVYSLTERPRDTGLAWYARPSVLACAVLALTLVLNVVFY
jgi:SSS family solute:Na+ symporter